MDSDSESEKGYSVLTEVEVRGLMENEINILAGTLGISRSGATVLLLNYKWSSSRVSDAWVEDATRTLENICLIPKQSLVETKCGSCLQVLCNSSDLVAGAPSCHHIFCKNCWGAYIGECVANAGVECLKMTCPHPGCSSAVGPEMVESLAAEDKVKEQYSRYLLCSYVDCSDEIKWCPAPGCTHAVEFLTESDDFTVICLCSYTFCWNCLNESHRPVNCENSRDWVSKIRDDYPSLNWINRVTKPCPSCNRPIQRSGNSKWCLQMICADPCGFEFCWKCLGSWDEHSQCQEVKVPITAGGVGSRYGYCYSQWKINHDLMQQAFDEIGKSIDDFVKEAWLLIVQCRRVMKWCYAYLYYLPEFDRAKKRYLKFLLRDAETYLNNYRHCFENRVELVVDSDLASKTRITRGYFSNLVKNLEEGLTEVVSVNLEEDLTEVVSVNLEEDLTEVVSVNQEEGLTEVVSSNLEEVGASNLQEVASSNTWRHWYCDRCTYANNWAELECAMCRDDLTILEYVG